MRTPLWRRDTRTIDEQIAHYESECERIMDRLCMESHSDAAAKHLRADLTTARYRLSVLVAERAEPQSVYVSDDERAEHEPCEAGTVGCAVAHSRCDHVCATW